MTIPDWDQYDTPFGLARAMWTHVWSQQAVDLPPARFRDLFSRIYDGCQDVNTLWQLGGATNDYLRMYADALIVPADLPERLLQSDDVEARVIGLKLLARVDAHDDVMIREIVRAIERDDQYESYGGLHELNGLLDRRLGTSPPLDSALVSQLQDSLKARLKDDDDDTRGAAARLLNRLAST